MTKARDIADFKFENITDTGTEGTKVASGTTGQRGSTTGQFRFNTTTGLAEYYNGSQFKAIDSPPIINSIDDGDIDSAAGGNQTIVITGSNFSSTVTVLLEATSGSDITPSTVTRNSETQITITHAKSDFVNANEPYSITVTNSSGLSGKLSNAIYVDNDPSWTTSAGALGTKEIGDTGNHFTLSASDPDERTNTNSIKKLRQNNVVVNVGLDRNKTHELNKFFFKSLKIPSAYPMPIVASLLSRLSVSVLPSYL